MLQLIYISTAMNVTDGDLEAILATSRRDNARDEITGLLMFNGKRFLQSLEGPKELVLFTYDRIKADPRHRAPVLLGSSVIDDRQFGRWDMAFQELRNPGRSRSLVEKVDALVASVKDPNVRAQFTSFARLATAA